MLFYQGSFFLLTIFLFSLFIQNSFSRGSNSQKDGYNDITNRKINDNYLTDIIIFNIHTRALMKWDDFEAELKKTFKGMFTIVIPGISNASTLRSSKNLFDNSYIKKLQNNKLSQYFIDTKYFYNNSTHEALKISENFGKKLQSVMPIDAGSIHFVGEGVSALSLLKAAKILQFKNPELYLELTAFNPMLYTFDINNFKDIHRFYGEFVFGDALSLNDIKELTLQNISPTTTFWIFMSTLNCTDIFCSHQKTSLMYVMAKNDELSNYKVSKIEKKKHLDVSDADNLYKNGIYTFKKIIPTAKFNTDQNNINEDIKIFKDNGYPKKVIKSEEMLVITKTKIKQKMNWLEFKKDLKLCKELEYRIIIPGITSLSTLHNSNVQTLDNCEYYIDTTDFYMNSTYYALTIYESFGERLYDILPKEALSIFLMGEGVSALSLAVAASKLTGSIFVNFIAFNPILLDFKTYAYQNLKYVYTELIFGTDYALSHTEIQILGRSPIVQKIWIFNQTLDCENISCFFKKTFTMYKSIKDQNLKSFKFCKLTGNFCLSNDKQTIFDRGILVFSKSKSDY